MKNFIQATTPSGFGILTYVWILLKHGTDVQAKDYYGETELHLAAKLGHNAVVELIIKHRAGCGETAPYHAAKNGYDVVVECLSRMGRILRQRST